MIDILFLAIMVCSLLLYLWIIDICVKNVATENKELWIENQESRGKNQLFLNRYWSGGAHK